MGIWFLMTQCSIVPNEHRFRQQRRNGVPGIFFGAPTTRFATLNLNELDSIPKDLERLDANQAECVQHEVMSRLRATSTLIR